MLATHPHGFLCYLVDLPLIYEARKALHLVEVRRRHGYTITSLPDALQVQRQFQSRFDLL